MQVSPTELEETLLAHPERLVVDAWVAGVHSSRAAEERVPRAWIVLSAFGAMRGEAEVLHALDTWMRERLSGYKQLRSVF